jgi:hypothetical protein
MSYRTKKILVFLAVLIAATTAGAQSQRVSLKPALKPGQENRYILTAAVDTHVSPMGANGITSNVHRETTATVLFRAVLDEKGNPIDEAVIEAIATRATVDGIDKPTTGSALVGQKIEYHLDSSGRVVKVSFPQAAAEAGLAELILSLRRWSPAGEVSVGQIWGQAGGNLPGDYGYISADSISEIAKGAATSYKLSAIDGDKATIDGAIALNQSGSSSLTTKEGRINISVTAGGNGHTRIEFDVTGSRIITATTESSFEGRLATIAPKQAGEKLTPREGSLVETGKFSVKLVQ